MADTQIRERDQLPVIIALTVRNTGVAASPSSLRWRLDCVTTQAVVLDWAGISAASTVTLTIPASANVIRDNQNLLETKRITVQANYGTDQQINASMLYDVINNDGYV